MLTETRKINIGNLSDLVIGIGHPLTVLDHELAIFRLSDNTVRVIENKSPHPKGGVLSEGLVSGEYVYCPVYDWKISLVDGLVQAPDQGKVKTYVVELDGDTIYLMV
ncbi:nitrite reductase small subunit NirD [Bacillus alkalicellulosilyticus]|uniref:nitrite reductase small subunit NirD n=1 Tax=Alkalihalobacterium alkalicellulosilyticum TaxID=1912214 RepID=UPI0009989555|nr:nitrite reductase small subunit NirD [Bacillus alkalicellulosilyticus]